jgi:hypothetical protein
MLHAQPKVKLETIFTINDDKTTRKEYMFKWVRGIVADNENNFYVYENAGTEIRKYNKDGKYIKAIGRYGEGPGELKYVNKMFINLQNEIAVYDPPNFRVSYFSLDGKYLGNTPVKIGGPNFTKINKYNNDSYVAFKNPDVDNLEQGNRIFIYDDGFRNEITSFGHSSIFWKSNDVFESHMDHGNNLNLTFKDDNIYVTKEYYDGQVYMFSKKKNWAVKIIEGKQIKKPGYDIYEKIGSSEPRIIQKNYSIGFGTLWQGKHRVFRITYRNISMGLFVYKNNYLVNFIVRQVGDNECEFGVDLFDIDGSYIGYTKIENKTVDSIMSRVFCMDNEGNILMCEGMSIIKKIKLTIN